MIELLLLGLLVAASTATVDYAHGRCVRQLVARDAHAAARWSVLQGTAGTIGFVLAVKITLWLIPFELVGWYVGTYLSGRRRYPSSVE